VPSAPITQKSEESTNNLRQGALEKWNAAEYRTTWKAKETVKFFHSGELGRIEELSELDRRTSSGPALHGAGFLPTMMISGDKF
jgi:hypothetical protein